MPLEPAGQAMKQAHIWDHYQNEGVNSFNDSYFRLRYLADHYLKPGEAALNIGTGAGFLERIAIQRGVNMSAVDPSQRTIQRLREELPGISAEVGTAQKMPFPDDSFDIVVASEVIEHFSDDELREALAETRRVLRPGGRFVGTVPADENLEADLVICPHCRAAFHRWGHQRTFSEVSLREELETFFQVRSVRERSFIGRPSSDWKARLLNVVRGLAIRARLFQGTNRLIFVATKV
jgi:ubiquinone/menaquinone biosynthesis C-methylase UbiE